MGTYLNPGNARFERMRNDQVFIDKSGLIEEINKLVNTPSGYLCMTRPRRFGKTYAANMLAAYYDIPRADRDLPAMIVELKWDKDAKTALNQAKQRNYPNGLEHYQGNMLLVGVNYDKDAKDKVHECIIEDWTA